MLQLSLFEKLYPKASHMRSYASGDDLKLPNKAIPFIWHFVSKIKIALLFNLFFYVLATALMSTESYFFGQIVEILATTNPSDIIAAATPIVITYLILLQFGSRFFYQLGHSLSAYNLPFLPMLVRQDLSSYLQKHSYRYFQDDYAGRLAGKVIEMPQAVRDVVHDIFNPVQFVTINGLMSITLFSIIDWRYGLLSVCFFVVSVFNSRYHIPKIAERADIAAEETQVMRGQYLDNVSNIFLIKVFARQAYESKRFMESMAKTCDAQQAEQRRFVFFFRTQHFINAVFQVFVVGISIYGFKQGALDVGDVATAFPLSVMLVTNIWWLMEIMSQFFSRFATIDEALRTIVVDHEVNDDPKAKPIKLTKPSIVFDNVRFAYDKINVFEDFSITIKAGEKIGLVGSSGAGKTSFVSLLLRLYDINNGAIKIDGQDISKVTLQSLRENITVIPQHTELFHRSIRENIAYGRLDAKEAEIIKAAKQAHAHDFIKDITDGQGGAAYDAQVGERGVKLSGGQRQRIAIARAILKDAPILVLDEATSALDSESESLIQDSLQKLMKGKTVIAIAHRLSTLSIMDRIIVMDKGKIIETGPHQDLLAQGGHYAKLWKRQSGSFIKEKE